MAFEVLKCECCGMLTPVPPTCDVCGKRVCGPCFKDGVCKMCRSASRQVKETGLSFESSIGHLDALSPHDAGGKATGACLPLERAPALEFPSNPPLLVSRPDKEVPYHPPAAFDMWPPGHAPPESRLAGVNDPAAGLPSSEMKPEFLKPTLSVDEARQMSGGPDSNHVVTRDDEIGDLRRRLVELRRIIDGPEVVTAKSEFPGCDTQLARLRQVIRETEERLNTVPTIEVVFLGPSRHGKSTLMNAMSASSILPMSDVKPCTASVVSMRWSEEWSINIKFVSVEDLKREWGQAVRDAEEYLKRFTGEGAAGDAPDDPRYLQTTLQRFIQLLDVDPDQSPQELVESVRSGKIPEKISRYLGKTAQPKAKDFDGMRSTVEKYLSTRDVFWTIVDSCEISGPFDDWHPQLCLVDLPGTNDTNPHRTAITNSLREKAQAVAIVTSDSNLGYDIESWLRNSTVLANFLEARHQSRQRLFIIRTKFDSYHPEIDESLIDDDDEAQEERLYREAIEAHKAEQKKAYHSMLRDIASPHLPLGATETERRKLDELVARLAEIPVFFVSALAHEAFAGRLKATKKQRRRLSEHFNDDPQETGIPSLREFLNQLAREYLAENYYEDLERRLEREVDQLVRFFRKEGRTLEAEAAGAGAAVQAVTASVKESVIPWMQQEARSQSERFREEATQGAESIRQRLGQVWAMSERRFRDKTEKWSGYAWNSLKATARKGGTHTTCRGTHIDINQDICSVLVDDLILAWSSYRDYLIEERVNVATQRFAAELKARLSEYLMGIHDPEVKAAIAEISDHLSGIADVHRLELIQQVNDKVQQLESIRQPAYEFVRETLSWTYEKITSEHGTGCQARMHRHLAQGFEGNLPRIREYVQRLVDGVVGELTEHCGSALSAFGTAATTQVEQSLQLVGLVAERRNHELVERQLAVVNRAIGALPAP